MKKKDKEEPEKELAPQESPPPFSTPDSTGNEQHHGQHQTVDIGVSNGELILHCPPDPALLRIERDADKDNDDDNEDEISLHPGTVVLGAVRVNNNLDEYTDASIITSDSPEPDVQAADDFHLVDAERVDDQEQHNVSNGGFIAPDVVHAVRVDSSNPPQGRYRIWIGIGLLVIVVLVIAVAVLATSRNAPSSLSSSSQETDEADTAPNQSSVRRTIPPMTPSATTTSPITPMPTPPTQSQTPAPATSPQSVTMFGLDWDPQNTTVISLRGDSSDSSLTGSIPTEIGLLTKLARLDLENNNLTGSIPTELLQLTQLTVLTLMFNLFTGSIPTGIQQLKELELLNFHHNSLTGSIPTEIGLLTKLTYLSFSFNTFLTGSIPTEIGRLTKLELLAFSSNSLTGPVPTNALANLVNMNVGLWFYDNQLSGSIPSSLCSLDIHLGIGINCGEIACDCCEERTTHDPCP